MPRSADSGLPGWQPQMPALEAAMFTEYTESIVYVALCLGVWGIGEGVGRHLGQPRAPEQGPSPLTGCAVRGDRAGFVDQPEPVTVPSDRGSTPSGRRSSASVLEPSVRRAAAVAGARPLAAASAAWDAGAVVAAAAAGMVLPGRRLPVLVPAAVRLLGRPRVAVLRRQGRRPAPRPTAVRHWAAAAPRRCAAASPRLTGKPAARSCGRASTRLRFGEN